MTPNQSDPQGAAPQSGLGDACIAQARAYSVALIDTVVLETGEPAIEHADGVSTILADMGADAEARAAAYLNLAVPHLAHPQDQLRKHFGAGLATLAVETRKLVEVSRMARGGPDEAELRRRHTELVRRLLLGFSRDLRVALLRLASRLQSLRFFTRTKNPAPSAFLAESMEVYAPLANRLGIWQVKWEVEDLSFRLLQPAIYKDIARKLDERRVEREQGITGAIARLQAELQHQNIRAQVVGRPKHIYSIWRKMQGKQLQFEQVMDLRALRIIVADVSACYAALSVVHAMWTALPEEFDDYIAKPKPNGYQSLHTVVRTEAGQIFEIQIRTEAMHAYAEQGSAAHWAYKEAGAKGYHGQAQAGDYQARIALARQLLALQQELAGADPQAHANPAESPGDGGAEDRIFVLTPQARIVELAQGSTAVDFAYALHTDLGHRCRGARVDGALIPLTTPLRSGQTVEIVAAKEGGPSRDWLNAELGYLRSPRARSKVRAWFNQIAQEQTIAKGRAQVERLLQREGKTSFNLQALADGLGFRTADELFERVGKDEFSQRQIEAYLRADQSVAPPDEAVALPSGATQKKQGGQVLVVGMGSLLTQLASCCKPAPPDAIGGFVTRERGVTVHRANCINFRNIATQHPERVIAVTWTGQGGNDALYPVDLEVSANDRQGLLRDISDVLTKERINVIAVSTRSIGDMAQMRFTVQLASSAKLKRALGLIADVSGVVKASRK
ncbi:MAG: bifunctional (p)ppGpp synthetase/guanosine-3',5'-bis(diphosphate) 3'-pyrophosphohydrolase [Thiomonas sp.]